MAGKSLAAAVLVAAAGSIVVVPAAAAALVAAALAAALAAEAFAVEPSEATSDTAARGSRSRCHEATLACAARDP